MKKWYVLGAIMVLALSATTVFALDLGSVTTKSGVTEAVKDVGKTAVVSETNKWLEQQNCQCDTKSGQITGCDLGAISKKLSQNQTGMKVALNRTATIKTEVNQKCYDYLHANINADNTYYNWWKSHYVDSNNVKIWLE